MKVTLLTLLCGLSLATSCLGAAEPTNRAKAWLQPKEGKWFLDQAKITDPSLPRVLLIGDSILIGYKADAIKALAGKANVDAWLNPYYQSEKLNGYLAEILEYGPYDVVHVNIGLHGWKEGRIKPGTFEPLTKEYIQIIRNKMPKAKIIWANTTPFTIKSKPTELDPVANANILEQNRMAAKAMTEMGVPVNDFYGLLINKLELGRGDTVHWTAPASQILANQAAASILQALGLETAANQKAKPRVVCFGDSITRRGYPALLGEMLGVEAINAGVAGHSSAAGLRRMQKDVLDQKPDVVVIFFGTNDGRVDAPTVHVPVEKYEANLNRMVDECEKIKAKVVLCTLPPVNETIYFQRHTNDTYVAAGGLGKLWEQYRQAALHVARMRQLPVVDLNQRLLAEPTWFSKDGVHPTPEGCALIAQFVAEAVTPLIKQ